MGDRCFRPVTLRCTIRNVFHVEKFPGVTLYVERSPGAFSKANDQYLKNTVGDDASGAGACWALVAVFQPEHPPDTHKHLLRASRPETHGRSGQNSIYEKAFRATVKATFASWYFFLSVGSLCLAMGCFEISERSQWAIARASLSA